MKSLKVAQVAPNIFPVPPNDHGGTERVIYDLSVGLQKMGVDLTVFAPSDSAIGVPRIGSMPSLQALEAIHGSVPPSIPAVLEAVRMEELRLRLDDFDIIHCHGEFFHAALLGTARPRSLTTIHWRVDELDRELFFEAFPDLPVAAISRSQQAALPQANRTGVVYHGIDPARFTFSPDQGQYLAFIGRMTDQKRPDVAIKVARDCGKSIRLAGTVDVGNPLYFQTMVEPYLSESAIYVGPLNDAGKASFLAQAEALLFPVDWPEPFGLVMIEAMACGTPVIAWNRGSVSEIVEDGVTGLVVENEVQAMEAVAKIGTLDRHRVRARFEERFTADRMAQDYHALYLKLLGR